MHTRAYVHMVDGDHSTRGTYAEAKCTCAHVHMYTWWMATTPREARVYDASLSAHAHAHAHDSEHFFHTQHLTLSALHTQHLTLSALHTQHLTLSALHTPSTSFTLSTLHTKYSFHTGTLHTQLLPSHWAQVRGCPPSRLCGPARCEAAPHTTCKPNASSYVYACAWCARVFVHHANASSDIIWRTYIHTYIHTYTYIQVPSLSLTISCGVAAECMLEIPHQPPRCTRCSVPAS